MSYNDLSTIKKINGLPADLRFFDKVSENDAFLKSIADADEDLASISQHLLPSVTNVYSLGSNSLKFSQGYITDIFSSTVTLLAGSLLTPSLKVGSTGIASLNSNELSIISSGLETIKFASSGLTVKAANDTQLKINNTLANNIWSLGVDESGLKITDTTNALVKAIFGLDNVSLSTILKVVAGTELNPSYTFQGDTSTGMYKDPASSVINFSVNGSKKLSISSINTEVLSSKLTIPSGSVTIPSLTFAGGLTTGLGSIDNKINIITNGYLSHILADNGITSVSENDFKSIVELYSINNFIKDVVRRAKGNKAIPLALSANTDIYSKTFEAYTDQGFQPVADISVFGIDDFSTGSYGTGMAISTVSTGSPDLTTKVLIGTQEGATMHIVGSLGTRSGLLNTVGNDYSINVSELSKLMVDTTAGDISIAGFTGGSEGQLLYIYKKVPTNTLTVKFNYAAPIQKVLLKGSVNYVNTNDYGGITLAFDQGFWREVSRS